MDSKRSKITAVPWVKIIILTIPVLLDAEVRNLPKIPVKADVAAILNITPDHLNRYDSFEDYAETKFNIFKNQNSNNLAILNLDDITSVEFTEKINSELKYSKFKSLRF